MGKERQIRHLAIIPDGNRRWAKKHGYRGAAVYQEGADRLSEILRHLAVLNIEYFTFWSSSFNNLTLRPNEPLQLFDSMYHEYLERMLTDPFIREHRIRIQVFGAWQGLLSKKTEDVIERLTEITHAHDGMKFSILIGYDGRLERGNAVIGLANDLGCGKVRLSANAIEMENALRDRSWTGALPDVDLIIRTGSWGDPHMSANFLTFLSGESQLVFPPVLWPDFSVSELITAFRDYFGRERRFGG